MSKVSNKPSSKSLGVELLRHYELNAIKIRERAGIQADERFDPFLSITRLKVQVMYHDEIPGLGGELLDEVNAYDAKVWSGWGQPLPDGGLLVVLNRNQTRQRERVTLLEEIAHQHFGHTPNNVGPGGRTGYSKAEEDEAYRTAAAALLPSKMVALAVYRGESAEKIANDFGSSTELVEMRIKMLGLWGFHSLGGVA